MKISLICFSLTGQETGERLAAGLERAGYEAVLYRKSKYLENSVKISTKSWAEEQFSQADGIIFIGACGIAVRSIASYVASKKSDPAVLVVDECGKFAISLLSGHLGGANELTALAAEILGAMPVVTTATDLHGRFAVDVFAKKQNCSIFHMKAAKLVSAALLAGEKVGFYSEFPREGALPEGLIECDRVGRSVNEDLTPETGVAVTIHEDCMPFAETVHLVPSIVSLGMGCRKNKEFEKILDAVNKSLGHLGIYRQALEQLTSIDIKKEEPGLLELSQKWELPFCTFTGNELLTVPGDFSSSAFVKGTVGVDNVCERSAVLASNLGKLIQKKQAADGVTTALAIREWRIHFE